MNSNNNITISELVDKANGYSYGMIGFGGTVSAHILFNEARENDKTVAFRQINQDDVDISFNKEDIEFIKDKTGDGLACYQVFIKNSGAIISICLFGKKDEEAQACHMLYGSYDDFVKELDLYELEEKVNKAKKAFVSISDNSTYLKNTYENVYLEEENEEDNTRRLVFFNGDKDNPTDKIAFTLYDDVIKVNDIWLMSGAKAGDGGDGWEGLKLRLYNQPFTEVKVSLLYV